MSVFEVDRGSFDSPEHFHYYLSENYPSSADGLYIVSGVTELRYPEFLQELRNHNWEVMEDYGSVKKIGRNYSESFHAEAYLTYRQEHQLFFLYTDQRKTEEIDHAINPLLKTMPGVHYLYISPSTLRDIREQIAENNNAAKITEFVAKRTDGTSIPAKERGGKRRTINYYGEDGLQTMREVEKKYGVLPHIMQIEAPNGLKFRVSKKGVFKLISGPLDELYEYIERCIEECVNIKRAYDHADYEDIETKSGVSIPASTPALIELKNALDAEDIAELEAGMKKSGYAVFDVYKGRRSRDLSCKIYDTENRVFFHLRAKDSQIRVFPEEKSDISTFFDFFEFIQSSVDEEAMAKAVKTES